MNNINNYKIKVGFIEGLSGVVLKEVLKKIGGNIISVGETCVYLDFNKSFDNLLKLKSVHSISLVSSGKNYNPAHINNHKSLVADMIDYILKNSSDKFKTFRISCAGSDSVEVRSIARYIETKFSITESTEADFKINIYRFEGLWEIAVQISARPLSYRDYKVINMSGAMDTTIAYALNSLCKLENKKSYLNPFCGSATLLIEAAQEYPELEKLVGLDNDKKNLSNAYQNIRKSGLIKKIELFERDILEEPDFGMFDVITADLPFGMTISKNKDLTQMYKIFIEYARDKLNDEGILAIYTSAHNIFMEQVDLDHWKIIKSVDLKLVTSLDSYLYPKIILLKKI